MKESTKLLIITAAIILLILIFDFVGIGMMSILSNSMSHEKRENQNYIKYWEQQNITEKQFQEFPLSKGFSGGDLLIYKKTTQLQKGDPGIFYNKLDEECRKNIWTLNICKIKTQESIHRYSHKNQTHSFFFPDNPPKHFDTTLTQDVIKNEDIIGKAIIRIPYAGLPSAIINCAKTKDCKINECITQGKCN